MSFYGDEGPFYEDDDEPSSGSEVPVPGESSTTRLPRSDDEIHAMLNEPLDAESVAKRMGPGNKWVHYMPGHVVLRKANEIFGHNGWGERVVSCERVHCEKDGDLWHVGVLAKVRVWTKGNEDVGHEDYGDSNYKGTNLCRNQDFAVCHGFQ